MSTSSEFDSPASELDLDLHFLPAWAQRPPTENRYAKFEGGEENRQRGFDRGGPRRDRPRPQGPPSGKPQPQAGRGFDRSRERDQGRPSRFGKPRREETGPQVELNATLIPEEKGVESLARQIKLTGRAYPLFDIASLVLKKPERYQVRFNVIKKPDGQIAQGLYLCNLDDTLWLSEGEAIQHILQHNFSIFYQTEKIEAEPPKGTYTFVAQCGMSGTILGPPNYHDYQTKLRRLHAERFSRLPFDAFKARVKIVKDEEIVKKWIEEQSWKTEWITLNVPEPVRLTSREEVEKHFKEVHLPNIVRPVESYTLAGNVAQQLPSPLLRNLVRRAWDDQRRFPLKIVNLLSQQFASHGLHFFKVNKTITHVAVARPRFLDLETTSVSDGVRRIIDFINTTPNCSRRKLLETLAPVPPEVMEPPQAPETAEGAETAEQTERPPAPPKDERPPTPEMAAVISDLHWLIHEGHVIEFSNGLMELAKKPVLRPVKPAAKPAQEKAPTAAEDSKAVQDQQAPPGQPEAPAATEGIPAGAETLPPQPPPGEPAAAETATLAAPEEPAGETGPATARTESPQPAAAASSSEAPEQAQPSEPEPSQPAPPETPAPKEVIEQAASDIERVPAEPNPDIPSASTAQSPEPAPAEPNPEPSEAPPEPPKEESR